MANAGLGDGGLEGIKIDNDEVDWLDLVLFDGRDMLGIIANVQNTTVNARMQGLDAPIEHFGKAGQFGHLADRQPAVE